jgi:hypothetical protein
MGDCKYCKQYTDIEFNGSCRFCYGRNRHLKTKFKITIDEYDIMEKAQDGKCACCGENRNGLVRGKQRRLMVDHDHNSGQIRKLLCHQCNVGLGLAKHDVNLLKIWIKYLEDHNAQPTAKPAVEAAVATPEPSEPLAAAVAPASMTTAG